MKFKSNDNIGNRSGRPKGAKNRTTEQIRATLLEFLDNNIESLQVNFEQLEPEKQLLFFERLLKHCVPAPISSIDQFSESEIDLLISKLKAKHYEIEAAKN